MVCKVWYISEDKMLTDNSSYSKYRELASQVDYDAPADYGVNGIGYKSASTRRTAVNLMKARQSLGMFRHDLLVAIRMVNNIERNIIQSEWENWLIDEAVKCKQASYMLRHYQDMDVVEDVAKLVKEYCDSCEKERRATWMDGKHLGFL